MTLYAVSRYLDMEKSFRFASSFDYCGGMLLSSLIRQSERAFASRRPRKWLWRESLCDSLGNVIFILWIARLVRVIWKPQSLIKLTLFILLNTHFFIFTPNWSIKSKPPNFGMYLPLRNLNLSAFLFRSSISLLFHFAKNNHNSEFYTAFIDTNRRFFPKKYGYSPFSSPWFSLGIYKPAWKKIPELNAKFVGKFWNRLLPSNLVH